MAAPAVSILNILAFGGLVRAVALAIVLAPSPSLTVNMIHCYMPVLMRINLCGRHSDRGVVREHLPSPFFVKAKNVESLASAAWLFHARRAHWHAPNGET